jgi:predicted HTH transcriptional regulator
VELTLHLGKITEKTTETVTETKRKGSVKTSERIKELMRKDSTITLNEIADILHRQPRTIEIAVKILRERGDVVHEGPDNNGEWRVLK